MDHISRSAEDAAAGAPTGQPNEIVRWKISIVGTVQGVGFRPFIHRLASRHRLAGFVLNDGQGVQIEIQGATAEVSSFVEAVHREAPPLAIVRSLTWEEIALDGDRDFVIRSSTTGVTTDQAMVPPDVATCDACLRELSTPGDRRHLYPFINCTDCGPRYTIISGVPYDRPLTTMHGFEMCARCRAEYEEISCRRYHAQPIACPDCGPRLWLADLDGKPLPCRDPIDETVRLLSLGKVAAIKGLGGFHLACDATNEEAVALLRQRKRRPHKPFAVMAPDLEAASSFAVIAPADREILTSWRRPIVLLPRCQASPLAAGVGKSSPWVGTMLPYTPLHQLLLARCGAPALVMTSGNRSDEPIAHRNDLALERLGGIADFFLFHDRPILVRADDSVVARMPDAVRPTPVRRSRGFVPEPVQLPRPGPSVIATGGDLKNTCCVTRGDLAILSQHVGDLAHADAADLLAATIDHLQDLFGVTPELVVHDLHPDYHSTRCAESFSPLPLLPIQHHHAHALACLAENSWTGPALAITLDGTGFGTDGQVWGGEVLGIDGLSSVRLAHLGYLPLLGGTRAVEEPWRMALSALASAVGEKAASDLLDALPTGAAAEPAVIHAVLGLVGKSHGQLLTSSAGRLFDAVASLLGIRHHSTFEGQAAIELERAATAFDSDDLLPYRMVGQSARPVQLDLTPAIAELVERLRAGCAVGLLARLFHNTLCAALVETVRRQHQQTGISIVALSGGVLQNRIIHRELVTRIGGLGLQVLTHRQVPPNDGGLALGQAWAGVLKLTA